MPALSDLTTPAKSVPFARDLAAFGDRVAVITADGEISYADLAARVATVADRLGADRRLVLLVGANTVDALVTYLAALAAGHPVLLVPGDNPAAVSSLVATYDPDVVVRDSEYRRAPGRHPHTRCIRTSRCCCARPGQPARPSWCASRTRTCRPTPSRSPSSWASAPSDRAATTLPMHYCYGLSVINSHLLRGAALLLTDLSVADAVFWDPFRAGRATSFAGVPYTFDLLDRVGFAEWTCRTCATSPRPAAGSAPTRAPLRRTGPPQRLGLHS